MTRRRGRLAAGRDRRRSWSRLSCSVRRRARGCARPRRADADQLPSRSCAVVTPRVPDSTSASIDLGTKVELTNDARTRGRRARLRRRAVPPGRSARRVRERTLARRPTSTGRRTITTTPPASAEREGRARVAARVRRHDRDAGTTTARTSWAPTTRPRSRATPDERHVVDNFEIPIRVGYRVGGRPRADHLRATAVAVAVGDRRGAARRPWCSSPPARSRGARCSWSCSRVLTVTELVHVVGLWDASTASFGTQAGRERLLARGHRARAARTRVDVAQGRRGGGAARAGGHHLPLRRRRAWPTSRPSATRRSRARFSAVDRAPAGERDPRPRRRAWRWPPRSGCARRRRSPRRRRATRPARPRGAVTS